MSPHDIKRSVELILLGRDHREITTDLIDQRFVSEVVEFFKKVVSAKLESKTINMDWYREAFLLNEADKKLMAAYSGLALKAIQNKRGTSRREIVLEESLNSFNSLLSIVDDFNQSEIEICLSITFKRVTVELNLSESLIVINALAMRKNQIRGGQWSALGSVWKFPC